MFIVVGGLLAFTWPAPVKYKVDTKASTLEWTGKEVTGEHKGYVPFVLAFFTPKGITNEVEFPATVKSDGKKLTASAKIVVDRTKYIRFRSASFFENLGDKVVSNDFELVLSLVANAQTGA